MEKKHAFFLAVLITFLAAGNYLYFKAGEIFPDREIVSITRVIDGDTVELTDGRRIRLLNINTPEKKEFGAELAYNYLLSFQNRTVELETAGIEKYGRVLGRLFDKGSYVNLKIVELGFASGFLIDEKEITEFKKAEKGAREKELGIWEKSENFGCLNVLVDKKEEFVIIEDNCNVNFESWVVKDESTKRYKFKEFKSNKFALYSGKGDDDENNLYWGVGNVWNNDKDSIFIRDEKGFLVYYDSYGY